MRRFKSITSWIQAFTTKLALIFLCNSVTHAESLIPTLAITDSLTLRMSDGVTYSVWVGAQAIEKGRKVHLVVNDETVDKITHTYVEEARLRYDDDGMELIANCDMVVVDRIYNSRNKVRKTTKKNRPDKTIEFYRWPMSCKIFVNEEEVGTLSFTEYFGVKTDS